MMSCLSHVVRHLGSGQVFHISACKQIPILKRPDSRKLSKCNTITLTHYCASIILGHSVFLFSISSTTIIVDGGTKAQGWANDLNVSARISPRTKYPPVWQD